MLLSQQASLNRGASLLRAAELSVTGMDPCNGNTGELPCSPDAYRRREAVVHFIAWLKELKRRKVVQVTGVYLVFAWGASLGLAELLPTFNAPLWTVRASIITLFAITPVVAMLAWYFEWTSRGVVRDPADQMQLSETQITETQIAETIILQGVTVKWYGQGREQVRYLKEDFTLGRDPNCTISISNPLASREHARVVNEDGQWMLLDLGSSNGTYVDGERVTRKQLSAVHTLRLGGGDPIEIQIFGVD